MITTARLQHLYDQYLELVLLEIDEFRVKPTEVRHLIERLGEFYCAEGQRHFGSFDKSAWL